jgi:PPOX class probable FMN-dependent enzyme
MTLDVRPEHAVTSLEQLAALSGPVGAASIVKEINYVHPLYARFIEASPFCTITSVGPAGVDVSPRGDPAGFVKLADPKTLLLPERRGNNRVDTLKNILHDSRVALLFLVPGVGETLRVTGRATISIDPAVLMRFVVAGKAPKCVLVIAVEKVYFQCARAVQRAGLWEPVDNLKERRVPTAGAILKALSAEAFDGDTYDRELLARQKATLY